MSELEQLHVTWMPNALVASVGSLYVVADRDGRLIAVAVYFPNLSGRNDKPTISYAGKSVED